MRLFEITDDRRHFRDRRPVAENEGGHDAPWIDRRIGVRKLFPRAEIDRHEGHRYTLLGEVDPDAARVGRYVGLIEFHGRSPGSQLRAAADLDGVAGDPAGRIRRQEGHNVADVVGVANALQCLHLEGVFAPVPVGNLIRLVREVESRNASAS